jgi:hypothetical protein
MPLLLPYEFTTIPTYLDHVVECESSLYSDDGMDTDLFEVIASRPLSGDGDGLERSISRGWRRGGTWSVQPLFNIKNDHPEGRFVRCPKCLDDPLNIGWNYADDVFEAVEGKFEPDLAAARSHP